MMEVTKSLVELIRACSLILNPLLGCVVLAAVLMLFFADRKIHSLCMVIGACIFLFLQLATLVLWFPDIGIFSRGDSDPDQVQKYFAYFGALDLIGRISFSYGILMLAFIQLKHARNPDFRRGSGESGESA